MSFDEEILTAIDEAVAAGQQRIVYAATVATASPFEVIFDGTTTPVPVLCDGQLIFQPNDRVVVIQNGSDFVAFANYSPAPPTELQLLPATADPAASPAGRVFYRSDLSRARLTDGSTWRSFLMEGLPAVVTTLSATAITATSLNAGSGTIQTSGTLQGGSTTVSSLNAGSGTIQTSGTVSAGTLSASTISGSPNFSGTPSFSNAPSFSGNISVSGTVITNDLEVNGVLNHDGGSVGFYGKSPVGQQSAPPSSGAAPASYTSTYLNALAGNVNDLRSALIAVGLIS